ncbi:MAG: hypothetical protein U0528_10375 [Anaerolineae bacterium]
MHGLVDMPIAHCRYSLQELIASCFSNIRAMGVNAATASKKIRRVDAFDAANFV